MGPQGHPLPRHATLMALTTEGLRRPPPEAGRCTLLSEQWILPPLQGLLGLVAQLQVGLGDCGSSSLRACSTLLSAPQPSLLVTSELRQEKGQPGRKAPRAALPHWLPHPRPLPEPLPVLPLQVPACPAHSPVFRRGKCSEASLGRLGTGGRKLLSRERVAPSVSKGSRVLWGECQESFRGVWTPTGLAAASLCQCSFQSPVPPRC